ncbi:MAG: hypothetical protein K6B75_02040, partial [Lachnospiraceae bacterium]|nr:hypothetical protein [Lachnospiraceae bacterium]
NYMEELYPDAVFYLFSDDLPVVKEALGLKENYKYVSLPGGEVTDICELLCLSLCTHRIMTKKSCFSDWAGRLHKAKEGESTMNIVFAEEELENRFSFTGEMLEKYLPLAKAEKAGRGKAEKLDSEDFNKKTTRLGEIIDGGGDVSEAEDIICEASFDVSRLGIEEINEIRSYYEAILIMQGKYIEAEQVLIKHRESEPDSPEVNFNLAVVTRLLGKTFSSYMYAANVCRTTGIKDYTEFFAKNFIKDDTFEIFKKLCKAKRVNLIVTPLTRRSYFMYHSLSLAIVLKKLGFSVEMIDIEEIKLLEKIEDPEYFAEYEVRNGFDLDDSYNYGIKMYCYARVEGMDIHGALLKKLASMHKHPTVLVTRHHLNFEYAKDYPIIYWDNSDRNDKEYHIMKYVGINESLPDGIYAKIAKAYITTDPEKKGPNVRYLPKYTPQVPYIITDKQLYSINHIDDEEFLRLAFEIVFAASEVV